MFKIFSGGIRKGTETKFPAPPKSGAFRATLELARKICDFSACRKPSVFVQKGVEPPAVRKGLAYTLEAMIAALLILSTLVTVYAYSSPKEGFDAVTIRDKGYFCVKHLDNRGLLRNYALQNDTAGIRSHIQGCLPRTLNFSASFCPACAPDVPANRTVVSINYVIAGEAAQFQPTSVSLFLWSMV